MAVNPKALGPEGYYRTGVLRKYDFTEDTIFVPGYRLSRIIALRSFGHVKAGDLGGYISYEQNLSHGGQCWVGGDAKVLGNARVFEHAIVEDNALVYGLARISGHASVFDEAEVYDWAQIAGHARVRGQSKVYGYSRIMGTTAMCGQSCVFARRPKRFAEPKGNWALIPNGPF